MNLYHTYGEYSGTPLYKDTPEGHLSTKDAPSIHHFCIHFKKDISGVCIVWGGCHTGVGHTSGDPSC